MFYEAKIGDNGGESMVKSIQRGVASGNTTITINEIDPNKSIIYLNFHLEQLCLF